MMGKQRRRREGGKRIFHFFHFSRICIRFCKRKKRMENDIQNEKYLYRMKKNSVVEKDKNKKKKENSLKIFSSYALGYSFKYIFLYIGSIDVFHVFFYFSFFHELNDFHILCKRERFVCFVSVYFTYIRRYLWILKIFYFILNKNWEEDMTLPCGSFSMKERREYKKNG